MNTAYRELFEQAAEAVICANDSAEMAETGDSLLLNNLFFDQDNSDEIFAFKMTTAFMAIASHSTGAAEAYINCFEALGLDEEFEDYMNNEIDLPEIIEMITHKIESFAQNIPDPAFDDEDEEMMGVDIQA